MISANQALEISKTSLEAKKYSLGSLENDILASAAMGLTSVNITDTSISRQYREHLTALGYKVLDCRFDDEWYVQISWDNK